MAKVKQQFVCRACGGVQHRWMGKCPDCGEWDGLEAFTPTSDPQRGSAVGDGGGRGMGGDAPDAMPIGEVGTESDAGHGRMSTGIGEFDRVLGESRDGDVDGQGGGGKVGGGVVPGSVVMIGGDPGVGKSTLMLMAAGRLAKSDVDEGGSENRNRNGSAGGGVRVLYVSSEESARQLRLRAERLGVGDAEELLVLADTNLARIVEQVRKTEAAVVVIDSIQMIYKSDLSAAPGSVSQLRTCAQELVYLAKSSGVAIFVVGHVTKAGTLAGPRLLEHLVDTVLYFEGDRYHNHRVIRAIKNRFGTTLEVGLFEMTDEGLAEVAAGAGVLAEEYATRSGSVVCPVLHGSRCLLVEIQALTATGFLGSVKRKTSGLDSGRLAMLIAVLEKRGGLRLADQDVFASSVGGMKVIEPAADLAVALAIAGAHYDRQLDHKVCAVGEVGLGGELRQVRQMRMRIAEAARLGFRRILCPPMKGKAKMGVPGGPGGCELVEVETVDRAMQELT